MSKIAEAYRRLRHTYGFGIHSPFAYTLVKGAVHPSRRYSWYGYEVIGEGLQRSLTTREIRESRMLLRIASELRINSAFLPQHTFRAYVDALKAANGAMHISNRLSDAQNCTLICSEGEYIPLDNLLRLIKMDSKILALRNIPPLWREKIFEALPHGLMLYGKRNALIINRPEMQKVAYSIYI